MSDGDVVVLGGGARRRSHARRSVRSGAAHASSTSPTRSACAIARARRSTASPSAIAMRSATRRSWRIRAAIRPRRCSRSGRWRPYRATFVQIIVDAKSGITGAGRTPATGSLFAEVDGDVRAYGLGGHRHEPEIAQELAALGIARADGVHPARRADRARNVGRRVRRVRARRSSRPTSWRPTAWSTPAAGSSGFSPTTKPRACVRWSARTTRSCTSPFAAERSACCARSTTSARARRVRPFRTSTSCCDLPQETGARWSFGRLSARTRPSG